MSKEKVLDAMKSAGKALKAGEIAEATGLDKKEVDKKWQELLAFEAEVMKMLGKKETIHG